MTVLHCRKCAGEGTIYTSRYGGNDPDVYPVGKCEACDGSGNQQCEAKGCKEDAVSFNEDGEALCQDCLIAWTMQEFEP
jgi:hypothetical protein